MAFKKTSKRRTPKIKKVTTPCPFCTGRKNPDYKDYKYLEKFLTDRAKIVGRDRSGVCSRHQRKLTSAIKRARHLALLPFTPSV